MKPRARRRLRPDQILGDSATPVFLVSPDRRIAFFNPACERLTGWPAEEVVGQLCEYVTDPVGRGLESLAASLCPPAEAFANRIASAPVTIACRNADPIERTVNFIPLIAGDGRLAAILGVIGTAERGEQLAPSAPSADLHNELASLRTALARRFGSQSLVCRSDAMLRVAEQLTVARQTRAGVLICGERGSGKEHLARAIHYESPWRTRSFVPLDCRRLTPLELEQALRRLMEIERDEEFVSIPALRPGTIFLSDVEHLPRDVQKGIVDGFRTGAGRCPELRLIASTTAEPAALENGDSLRPDFFHLVTTMCIVLPPLRRRMEDLRPLAQHLLEELNRGDARQFNGFLDEVWDKFAEYNWPGNVAELLAVIREARAVCNEPRIGVNDLPFRFRSGLGAQAVGPPIRSNIAPLEPFLAHAEKEQIERALKQCRQNKSKAAQLLGMTRPRLYRRMQILGIRDDPEPG